ncbi:uncharacterized protein FTOL_07240 [Fusarium torulosum]|uniref:Uncharacterized protein n=1 Tax=Fusarium torulosum TaxID=33205 RepID=A0AAE8SIT4_9HYPO|nr:uncharacterized protein FTOL_07240 [Fusarium torulosum]
MLRPTGSSMPIGIGFLLLSFGAQLSSAIPYNYYPLDERDVATDTRPLDVPIPTTTSVANEIVNALTTTSLEPSLPAPAQETNTDTVVVDITTSNGPPVETPTTVGDITEDTTTAKVAPLDTTDMQTTSDLVPAPVSGSPTDVVGTPGSDTTADTDVPPGTETAASTNVQEPAVDTTTDADIPPVATTSDVVEPVDTTTNVPQPGIETATTSNAPIVDTTTEVPAPGTETSAVGGPIVETTNTEVPAPDTDTATSSVGAPVPETTTDSSNDAPSTTAPAIDPPKTTDQAAEPTEKPSDSEPSSPVTAPPQQITAVPAAAQSTASEVNSQVNSIIPIIVAWTNNPDGLKTDTLNQVNNLINGVKGAITDLGGSSSSGCNGKRRRGLGDIVSGIINTLSCVVSNLEDVTGKITTGVVTGVEPIVGTLTNNNQDLKDQSEEDDDEDEQSKTEDEEESKTEESKTEKPTSTEAETTSTTETTATSGECKMREATSIAGASDTQPKTSIPFPSINQDATATETSAVPDATETGGPDATTSTEAANVPTTTSQDSEPTTSKDESAPETSTEASGGDTTSHEVDTSVPATSAPSTFLTTTRPSSDDVPSTIASTPTEDNTSSQATTTAPVRTYYPCTPFGGPRVEKPYCQCETTLSEKRYFATASLIDGACAAYTEFPSSINPTTQAPPPPTEAPINEPLTQTVDGTVLAWSSYKLAYGQVYEGVTATMSEGLGEPRTIETPVPTQTAVDNNGGGQCGTSDGLSKQGLGDACDGAINHFEDDTIYTGYTTRYDRSKKGILMLASAGQAGCIAKFSCDDYGIGMSGKHIKEARENAKANNDIWMCGHIELSNSCKIVMDYCTNCNNEG